MSESLEKPGAAGQVARATPGSGGRSLAEMVAPSQEIGFAESFPTQTLIKVVVLAGLLLLLNYRYVHWLAQKWTSDTDWTHGFVIPLFSLYLLFARRTDLFAARRRACGWGLAIMLASLTGEILGFYPVRNYWISQICMIGVLFGLVLYLAGPSVMRVAWLPIVFLIFAIPISPRVYTQISVPLQNISAKGAVLVMRAMQVQISSSASAVDLISRSGKSHGLTVAEACSGMRLLMAFLALGVATAYLEYKPLWQRIVLVAAAVPIAVFCNVLRVTITGWMYYIDKPELGQDFMHTFTGMLMLIPAFGMLWLLSWIMRNLFIEEAAEDRAGADAESQA